MLDDEGVAAPYWRGLREGVLRRYQVQATLPERDTARRAFRFAGWELNLRTRRLTSVLGEVELSNGEFSLLCAFCRAPQRVLTRDQLLDYARGRDAFAYDRAVDVQVSRLRRKLEAANGSSELIKTVRNEGYIFAAVVRRG